MANSTLVLLHPLGLDGKSFASLRLDAALAPDLLGHGSRPRVPGMTLPDLAKDVAARCPGPLDLVGTSLGAIVALHLALDLPERVRSLLIACCFGAWADPGLAEQRAREAEGGMDGVVESTLTRYFTPAAIEASHPAVLTARATLLAMNASAYADSWRAIATHDVRERLDQLKMPVTCVAGTGDVAVPPERLREIAVAVRRGAFVEVRGPHMAYLEEPGSFRAAIDGHLARAGN